MLNVLLSVLFATRGLQNRKHFLCLFIFASVCSYICLKENKCGRRDGRVKSDGVKSWVQVGVTSRATL